MPGGNGNTILVCGFESGTPCKTAGQGDAAWADLRSDFDEDLNHQGSGSYLGKYYIVILNFDSIFIVHYQ